MDNPDWLAERFEEHRAHLRAVAYRMLGSLAEADEAVQDSWLRVSRAGADGIENLRGWLTTIVARVCLNALQARKARPRTPPGCTCPIRSSGPRAHSIRSMRCCWPTLSVSRCKSCSTRCPQPSDLPSSFTTCSTCRSRRSGPWWVALQRGQTARQPRAATRARCIRAGARPGCRSPATGRRCVLRGGARRRLRRARGGAGSRRGGAIGWRESAA